MRRAALRAVGAFAAAALVAAVPATVTAGSPTTTSAGRVPSGNVIVVLKDQHAALAGAGKRAARATANHAAAMSLMATARTAGARDVHAYSVISAFSATVGKGEAAALATNPAVAAVYPDLQVRAAPRPERAAAGAASSATPQSGPICPADPSHPQLEPEALQLTRTAFSDPSTPQAQNIVDGTGVKVGFIADGLDINNPDFIRANGQHVFVDYQDFSGDGTAAPSGAAEAFGDASAIAAQGRQVYDLSQFVNPAHPLPPGCNITIRGVAPGASLVGLKAFGNSNTAASSAILQAIDYAVNVAGVDVLNESFGANPYPDNGNDPITLADEAAVAAGVTVVASTGDAGPTGTIGSPSSSGSIIAVAASTSFRSYIQTTNGGAQLSNGSFLSDQISSLSSGGITQAAGVPDLSAPGDLGWALCTPNLSLYHECTTNGGGPSPIQDFGGTSQSSPFTAGAAALVIEAYENTHRGVRPAPGLVKRLLTSTADDLGHRASEQGAGRLDTLAAVQAAESWQDANGTPAAQGDALVVDQSQLSLVGNPGANAKTTLAITNTADHAQTVSASLRTLGDPTTVASGDVTLNTATAPAYIDAFGISRSFVSTHFDVPAGHDELAVSLAAPTGGFAARIILLDPNGVYSAYSIPQGGGNYNHVDVATPVGGTWTAVFAMSTGAAFNGALHFLATTSDYTAAAGKVTPTHLVLQPGQTETVKVKVVEPAQPGDLSASVQLASDGGHVTSVPLTERAVVERVPTTFSGVITGGNGRGGAPAQTNVYYLKLASHQKLLRVHVQLTDPNELVYATLTGPDGQPASFQTNVQTNTQGQAFPTVDLWIYHPNPTAGRWILTLAPQNPVSGLEVQQPFTVTVDYDRPAVQASLPRGTRVTAGTPITVPVQITNTASRELDYVVDPRLTTVGDVALTNFGSADTLPLPLTASPLWIVPPHTDTFTLNAAASLPVILDTHFESGEPELASAAGTTPSIVASAGQLPIGPWLATASELGPFPAPAPAGSVTFTATAHTQLFDPDVATSIGDAWHNLAGDVLRVPAGGSGTVNVTITPSGAPGSVHKGVLYVTTIDLYSLTGDEIVALPYSYKIR